MFNWLGQDMHGLHCLDVFAGSGALGFEAASRGAASVMMVENNRAAFRALQENGKKLVCANLELRCEDGIGYLRRESKRYDVIFLDPPFQSDYLTEIFSLLADKLTELGLVYVESGKPFEPDAAWQVVKWAKAGNVHYQLLRLTCDTTPVSLKQAETFAKPELEY